MQISIPDESSEFVVRLAESQGFDSVDGYINSLILEDSQRIDAENAQADDAEFFEPVPMPSTAPRSGRLVG